jgi:anti-sigma factor RsiW
VNQLSCAEFAALAPELALDLLSGAERAAALAHLAGCRACQTNLDELARTADALLLVAPIGEPSAGFESRVLARLAAEKGTQPAEKRPLFRRKQTGSPPRPGRANRWIGPLSLVAALVVAAATVGVIIGRHTARHPEQSEIRTATVWADQFRSTCHVVAIPGHDGQGAEILLRLDEVDETPAAYPVLVEPATGGRPVPIGKVQVVAGHGAFDRVVPARVGQIRGLQVLEEDGRSTRYQASFAPV